MCGVAMLVLEKDAVASSLPIYALVIAEPPTQVNDREATVGTLHLDILTLDSDGDDHLIAALRRVRRSILSIVPGGNRKVGALLDSLLRGGVKRIINARAEGERDHRWSLRFLDGADVLVDACDDIRGKGTVGIGGHLDRVGVGRFRHGVTGSRSH
jgi:hypothetical protein